LHADYDRGFFLALETYMRKLERSNLPQQKVDVAVKRER